jgi:hypothetical protein
MRRAACSVLACTLASSIGASSLPAMAAAPRSQSAVRLGLLPTVVVGTDAQRVRERVEDEVDQALEHASFTVDRFDPKAAAAQASSYCTEPVCWQSLAGEREVTHLLQIAVTFSDPDWRIEATVVEGSAGRVVAVIEQTCDLCGFDELSSAVADVTAAARRKLEASVEPAPVLVVRSTPPGATVSVDGEVVGKTPLEVTVAAGDRDVQIAHEGFVTERRRLAVVDGVHHAVTTTLRPALEAEPVRIDRRDRALRASGAVALGVGLALVGVGVALFVLDSRPIERDCIGGNVDADGDCMYLYDTIGGGIGSTVAGGSLAITGVTLIAVGSRRSKKRAELRPRATGLAVRF